MWHNYCGPSDPGPCIQLTTTLIAPNGSRSAITDGGRAIVAP